MFRYANNATSFNTDVQPDPEYFPAGQLFKAVYRNKHKTPFAVQFVSASEHMPDDVPPVLVNLSLGATLPVSSLIPSNARTLSRDVLEKINLQLASEDDWAFTLIPLAPGESVTLSAGTPGTPVYLD